MAIEAPPSEITREIDELIERSRSLKFRDSNEALVLAQRAVELAMHADADVLARALLCRGDALANLERHAEAESDLLTALSTFEQRQDGALQATAEHRLGSVRMHQGQTARAFHHYLNACDLARQHGNPTVMSASLTNIGLMHHNAGDYAAALEAYLDALSIDRQLQDREGEVQVQLLIAHTFDAQKRREETLEVLLHATAVARELQNTSSLVMGLSNLGVAYGHVGNFELARQHHLEALELAERAYPKFAAPVLTAYASMYSGQLPQRDPRRAIELLRRAVEYGHEYDNRIYLTYTLLQLGVAHARAGELDEAQRHLQDVLELSTSAQYAGSLAEIYLELSELHEARGEHQLALHHLRQLLTLREQQQREQAEQRAQMLMVKYRTEQAQHEAQLAAKEAEIQKLRSQELAQALHALQLADAERQTLLARLAHQAEHDPLTGLANRARFERQLEQALVNAHARSSRSGVIFLDLDGFKGVNDTLGHHVGDRLLQEIATRLQTVLRDTDTLARFGGDEFTVVLHALKDPREAERVARRLLEVIAAPMRLAGQEVRVTGSAGVALYPDDASDGVALQQAADAAMYEAKHAGKNLVRRAHRAARNAGPLPIRARRRSGS